MNKEIIKKHVYISLSDKDFLLLQENLKIFFEDFLCELKSYSKINTENFKRIHNVLNLKNKFREDVIKKTSEKDRKILLSMFPCIKDGYIYVPKIL